ncbi:hypothetical protein [Helicobacter sp. T3_23-1056]
MKPQHIQYPKNSINKGNINASKIYHSIKSNIARLKNSARFYARHITPFVPLAFFAKYSQKKRALFYVLFLSLFVLVPIALHAKDSLDTKALLDTLKSSELTNAKIISTQDSNINGFSFVIIQKDNFQIPFFASNDGKTLMILSKEAIISQNAGFKKLLESTNKKVQDFNEKAREDAVIAIFQKYPNMILRLDGKNKDSKKSTTYLVLDTDCPYCKQELSKIDSYLANGDLQILIVGALSLESIKKAAFFYTKLNEQKTQASKISYLKKAFEPNYKAEANINADMAMNISSELGGAGLQGVPYIIKR